MDNSNLFCLKWSNFQKNVSNEFKKIQMDEDLVDITFVCGEGESFGAHKLVLFACSPFLKRLLKVSENLLPYLVDVYISRFLGQSLFASHFLYERCEAGSLKGNIRLHVLR